MHSPFLLLALTVSLNPCLAQLKSCFYYDRVDGSSGRDNFPCDPYANVSACCPGGFKCGTNLYCAEDDGGYDGFVGTCTDVTWKDPACPFVLNSDTGFISFTYTLNTTHCGGDHYCPGPDNEDCCNRGQWVSEISFSNGNDLPTTAAGLSTYYEAGVYTASTTGLQFTQATTDGSMPRYATPSPTSSTPTGTAPSTSALPGNTGRAGLGPSASAGIGAGAAIGACAAATVLYLLIKRRVGRRQRSFGDEGVATTQRESSWKTGLIADSSGMEMDATPSEKVSELPAVESSVNNNITAGPEIAHQNEGVGLKRESF